MSFIDVLSAFTQASDDVARSDDSISRFGAYNGPVDGHFSSPGKRQEILLEQGPKVLKW